MSKKQQTENTYLNELIDAHWDYVNKLLKVHKVDQASRTMIEFHYKSSAKHFWKHGIEYINEITTDLTTLT